MFVDALRAGKAHPMNDGRRSKVDGRVFVVKLGGSLITNKDAEEEICPERIIALGKEIAELPVRRRARLVVVLGGGSFGNVIPRKYSLLGRGILKRRVDFWRMTAGMFRVMSAVAELWAPLDLSVFPLQTAALLRRDRGSPRLATDGIAAAHRHGLMPLLTGELLFAPDGSRELLSSDWLLVALAASMEVERVVVATDSPGIVDRTSGETIREIRPGRAAAALATAGPSRKQDLTGGMSTKLSALLALAEMGIESAIVDGRESGELSAAMAGRRSRGTFIRCAAPEAQAAC